MHSNFDSQELSRSRICTIFSEIHIPARGALKKSLLGRSGALNPNPTRASPCGVWFQKPLCPQEIFPNPTREVWGIY